MADQKIPGLMGHVLEELRKVEGAATRAESIYTPIMDHRGTRVVVMDPKQAGGILVEVRPAYSKYDIITRERRIIGLKFSGISPTRQVCHRGRRFVLPVALQRLGDKYETPWIGYNYEAMHKAVVGFLAAVAQAREEKRADAAARDAARDTLLVALNQDARHPAKPYGVDGIFVQLYESKHVYLDGMSGRFSVGGRVTPENAAQVINALEVLERALETKS